MNVYEPMEIADHAGYHLPLHQPYSRQPSHLYRRARLARRDQCQPTAATRSAHWLDTDGDGKYDTLEVETRAIKGPRSYDTGGLPLHADNKTSSRNASISTRPIRKVMWDEITTIDNALTRPWTVKKKYARDGEPRRIGSKRSVRKTTRTSRSRAPIISSARTGI